MSPFKNHNEPAKPSTQGMGTGRQPWTNRKDKNPFYSGLEKRDCTTLISVGKKLSSISCPDT